MSDTRIDDIEAQILAFTRGDLEYRNQISDAEDGLDGIIIGLNMLGEDLAYSTKLVQELIQGLEVERNEAQKSAQTDGLTSLANRKQFDETLAREFLREERSQKPLALIMLDLDHFKRFNDRYGHVAGDECLRRVAAALQTALRRVPDLVARFGGEEFVVILPDTTMNGATVVAERLRMAVESLAIAHEDSETSEYVTVSIGVATSDPRKMDRPDRIVQLADEALYSAKRKGRNRVEISSSSAALEVAAVQLDFPEYF